MLFGKALQDFRKHELDIKSNEAAYRLGIEATTYSNYENGVRAIPIELLPTIKEKFGISDERFLQMLLGETKRKQKTANELHNEMQTLRERYIELFSEDYYPLIFNTPDLRDLIALLGKLDVKKRKAVLSTVRHIVHVQADLMKQVEKLTWQVEDLQSQIEQTEE